MKFLSIFVFLILSVHAEDLKSGIFEKIESLGLDVPSEKIYEKADAMPLQDLMPLLDEISTKLPIISKSRERDSGEIAIFIGILRRYGTDSQKIAAFRDPMIYGDSKFVGVVNALATCKNAEGVRILANLAEEIAPKLRNSEDLVKSKHDIPLDQRYISNFHVYLKALYSSVNEEGPHIADKLLERMFHELDGKVSKEAVAMTRKMFDEEKAKRIKNLSSPTTSVTNPSTSALPSASVPPEKVSSTYRAIIGASIVVTIGVLYLLFTRIIFQKR